MTKSPFTPSQEAVLKKWTTFYPHKEMGLIEALRSVQEWDRHIKPEAAQYVAELFGLPFNRVWGVATFFPSFTTKPTGKHRIGLCHGLSCWLAGSPLMAKRLRQTLGVAEKEVTKDGRFSWEEMECLGACDHGPALLVNDRLQGQATEAKIAALAKELA
ncbi:MAG: NAD(P)H-dependent oxidoreductase subunit E [Elusimicrobiota bacterium]